MGRNLLGILAVFVGALALVAVTFSATTEQRADFTYVSGSEPKSLDPHIMTGQLEGRIADAIFEGLVVRDPQTLRPVPGVAREMPEVSADLKRYVFRLRPEARWTDGTPVTAHDFAWSWRRLQRPDLGAEYAYIHHMIEGAEIYNTYSVQAEAIQTTVLRRLDELLGGAKDAWQSFYAGLIEHVVGVAQGFEASGAPAAGIERSIRTGFAALTTRATAEPTRDAWESFYAGLLERALATTRAFASHGLPAEAVEAELRRGLGPLVGARTGWIAAGAWRAFLDEVGAFEALKNVVDPVLVQALALRDGRLERAQLEEVRRALVREGQRRRRLFEHAEAHYGVDEGVWAEDDHTLVVQLVAPCPYFLDVVAFYSSHPVPRQVVGVQDEKEKYVNEQDWFLPDKIVANGPYRIQRWRVNDRIRLVKSETYWNAAQTQLETIDALSIENYTTALNLYLTDAADWVPGNYPTDLVDQLKDRPDFYDTRGLGVYYYRFNTTRPPFDDPLVRRAFCMAIDRQLIVDQVMRLGQVPAYHLVPPDLEAYGYEQPESRIRFDPEEARRLLAEAGYPGGAGFPPDVGILFNTSEGHKKVAEVVADHLRRNLGIEVTAYNQEWQAYQATTQKLDYWLARAGWIGDYVDPNTFMDMWVTNGGNNQTGWGDPVYDRLVRSAANIDLLVGESESLFARLKEPERARDLLSAYRDAPTDAARAAAGAALRMHCFREAEAILFQDAFPILPVYYYVWSGLVKPHVKGFYSELDLGDGVRRANLQDIHPLRGLRVER